jgi:hypothetical protein
MLTASLTPTAPLRQSSWFTQGWTLQELIAPQSVEFFSRDGKRIGDKESLEVHIREITGIPARALYGSSLADISITERMSWVEKCEIKREIKRRQDVAYSLLGIFDVSMPLIYGEGIEKAMKRKSRSSPLHRFFQSVG